MPCLSVQSYLVRDFTRLHNVLERAQCADQVGFRSKLGIDHAFPVLETMIGKSIEWALWCASLDLRKTFDRIAHRSLFEALHDQGGSGAMLHKFAISTV